MFRGWKRSRRRHGNGGFSGPLVLTVIVSINEAVVYDRRATAGGRGGWRSSWRGATVISAAIRWQRGGAAPPKSPLILVALGAPRPVSSARSLCEGAVPSGVSL